MAKNDLVKRSRSVLLTANKYQDKIILLTFLPSAFVFLSFICIIIIGNPIVCKFVFHTSFSGTEKSADRISEWIVFLISLNFIFSLLMAFTISHNMVGAFGRINKELDEIIARMSQKAITCRPHDDLTKELLKRINVLVKHYVGHQE